MQLSELWRTTTFRLTALYGLLFALGTVALLGMVYLQSAVYQTHRVDRILITEADSLRRAPQQELDRRIDYALAFNGDQIDVVGLFSPRREWIRGNMRFIPSGLAVNGPPVEIPPTATFPDHARVILRRLKTGELLVVGRDVNQLRETRAIITSALVWSGILILVVGLACGVALSVRPLRRLRLLQSAGQEIAAGDLKRRMPVSQRHDELDMFAGTVNYMMDEVERLMSEVKGATDTIAHDLRTPLAHARAQLTRIQQAPERRPEDIHRVIGEIDVVLERFRALLRISELEARGRHAGFVQTDLANVLRDVVELYQPLAEAQKVGLSLRSDGPAVVEADPKLLFEAISNLVDNAIKFTGRGGSVELQLLEGPVIVVSDNGPGIAARERAAVLQRFYRSERSRQIPGSGLGLTSVAAILRLHRFTLELQDAGPGLRAVIRCRPSILAADASGRAPAV